MLGYSQRWEQEGEAWKAILDRIELVADDLFREQAVEVARERWDTPGIALQWYTDDTGKAIQVHLFVGAIDSSSRASIGGCAWG